MEMVTTTRGRPNPRKQAERKVGTLAALAEADAYLRMARLRVREAYEEAAAIETEHNDKAA